MSDAQLCPACGGWRPYHKINCALMITTEPPPITPIPDRKGVGEQPVTEEYSFMVDPNENMQDVENETVGGPEEENQPEEEQGVNHGQDYAGAGGGMMNPTDDDDITDETDVVDDDDDGEDDIDGDNDDTEVTDRKFDE